MLPSWEEVKPLSPFTHALYRQFDSLELIDGVLYRIFVNDKGERLYHQIVLPRVLKKDVLAGVHCDLAAHLMYDKCLELL